MKLYKKLLRIVDLVKSKVDDKVQEELRTKYKTIDAAPKGLPMMEDVVRDFLITSLRIFMENNGQMMQTSNLGKLKTVAQFISINFILLCLIFINYDFSELITFINDYSIIYILMFMTTVFTAITGLDYFVKNHKMIKLIILKK